jgi:tetratricopeptide (TPR) repeat protein
VLEGLARDGVLRNEVRRLLGQVCLLYGDALASLDRTALATIAYRRAVEVEGPAGEAAEHAAWLRRRLAEEEAKARKTFQLAARGEGNLGDALVGLATAACRRADFEEGKRIFDELEQQVGLSPALRYHRAVQLLRETDPAKAVAELRAVVEAEPGLARAHFELGRLLEERGDYDGALRAYDESLRRFREGVSGAYEEWGIEAQERVEELTRLLVLQPPR